MKKIYFTLAFAFFTAGLFAQDVSIGDPDYDMTSQGQNKYRSPWTVSYNYSYVQTIYLKEEIATSGTITKLTYYFKGEYLDNSHTISVYMGTIPDTKDEFIEGDYNDWLPTNQMVKVFEGSPSYTTLPGNVVIDLQTPFDYSNDANLIIAVYEHGSGNDYDANDNVTFKSTGGTLRRVLYYLTDGPEAGDNPLPDLNNLPEADNYNANYADIVLHFGSASPINLASFTAARQNPTTNILKWSTGNEHNNKGFEVQSSVDGTNFHNIGFVASKAPGGNSNTTLDYSFLDTRAGSVTRYYRLNQIDFDGKTSLSRAVLVKGDPLSFSAQVYPNPVRSSLNLQLTTPDNNNVLIEVSNMEGRVVHRSSANLMRGENRVTIDLSAVPAGVYTVRATLKDKSKSIMLRFMKY